MWYLVSLQARELHREKATLMSEQPPASSHHQTAASAAAPVVSELAGGGSPWPWRALSALLVLAVGGALFAARGALAPWFGLRPSGVVVGVEVAVAEQLPTAVVSPPPPLPSLEQLEQLLLAVPPQLLALIEDGRGELPSFAGLTGQESVRQRQMWNRFRAWGPIWHNRLAVIEQQMPKVEAWQPYVALQPAQRTLEGAFKILGEVPDVGSVAAAEDLLTLAEEALKAFLPGEPSTEEPASVEAQP